MAAYFLDSSAIVKRYVAETGTSWVVSLFDLTAGNKIYVSRIASVEVVAAVARRRRGKSLAVKDATSAIAEFRLDLASDYLVVEVAAKLIDRAMIIADNHGLRGYDAVHLATALEANTVRLTAHASPLIMVSADRELNSAARAEGLTIEDPNAHP